MVDMSKPQPEYDGPSGPQDPGGQPSAAPAGGGGYGPPQGANGGYAPPAAGWNENAAGGHGGYGPSSDGWNSFPAPAMGAGVPLGVGPLADGASRAVARLIDFVISGIAFAVPVFFIMFGAFGGFGNFGGAGALAVVGGFILLLAFAVLFQIAYEVAMVALKGATVGKMVMGIRVVRADGQVAGWGPSFARWALPFGVIMGLGIASGGFLSLLGYIVYISFLWDNQKQGWHDKVAKTWVVKTR